MFYVNNCIKATATCLKCICEEMWPKHIKQQQMSCFQENKIETQNQSFSSV